MMKVTKFSFVTILLLISIRLHCFCQTSPNEYVEEKPVLMKNEATIAFFAHSSGIGAEFRRSFNVTGYKKRFYEFDFLGMKHPKEYKTVNQSFDNAKSYVYGKLNTFSILRLGTGLQRTLYSKAERNGVEIRMIYSGGLSIGILKPVYLDILESLGNNQYDVIVERYDPAIHNQDDIYGRAPFTDGITELKFRPGLYAKLGYCFEYAPIFENMKALEVGLALDAFPKEIPIMAYAKNKQLFFTFYITLMYGRKW